MDSNLVDPTAEMFEPLLDSEFDVHIDPQTVAVARLISVTRLPPATTRQDLPIRRVPFSLVFELISQIEFDQRMYTVQHESNGSFEMFLVPVGFGEYQAIFN